MLAISILTIALVGLTIGPVLVSLWPEGRAWRAALDGLSAALVGGLCLLQFLPHAVEEAGLVAIVVAAAAAAVPRIFHLLGPTTEQRGSRALFALLCVHAVTDGAALRLLDSGGTLAVAVAAHRVPVGLTVFLAAGGSRLGWAAIGVLAAATLLGFAAGGSISLHNHPMIEGLAEAVVAGALLHIVFDRHQGDHTGQQAWTVLGAAAGLAVAAAAAVAAG